MKRIFLATFFLIISGNWLHAQFNPQKPSVLPQAPNTAALGKFGSYEVSHFTGVPSISIPLYTIKTAGFEAFDGIYSNPLVKTYKYGWDESGFGRANFYLSEFFFFDAQKFEWLFLENEGLAVELGGRKLTARESTWRWGIWQLLQPIPTQLGIP